MRVWHDGWMTATWFPGPYAEFIAASKSGFEHGVPIAHFLGGFSCEIAGDRAVAQTKVELLYREGAAWLAGSATPGVPLGAAS